MNGITDPSVPRTGIDPAVLPRNQLSHLMNSLVVPRPIAWVSTRSPDGVANVAPHSYTMIVSVSPPIIAFSSSGAKDTLRNIRATGEFVFNFVSEALAEAMNLTSADFPPEVSEFAWAGLTPVPSTTVGAPRVGESPAALECRLRDIQEYGDEPSYLILGDVVHIALNPAYVTDGILDATMAHPVGRLSRTQYSASRHFFEMTRPAYRGLASREETPLPSHPNELRNEAPSFQSKSFPVGERRLRPEDMVERS